VIHVELIEAPQEDWWVVADGRVLAVYLKTPEDPNPYRAAERHADELRGRYGMSILTLGTTWRSRAFDHLEDLSCLRGTCCRFRSRDEEPEEWEAA